MRVAATEAAGRRPAVPAQGGPPPCVTRRRTSARRPCSGSPPEPAREWPPILPPITKSLFSFRSAFFGIITPLVLCDGLMGANGPHVQKHGLCFLLPCSASVHLLLFCLLIKDPELFASVDMLISAYACEMCHVVKCDLIIHVAKHMLSPL